MFGSLAYLHISRVRTHVPRSDPKLFSDAFNFDVKRNIYYIIYILHVRHASGVQNKRRPALVLWRSCTRRRKMISRINFKLFYFSRVLHNIIIVLPTVIHNSDEPVEGLHAIWNCD